VPRRGFRVEAAAAGEGPVVPVVRPRIVDARPEAGQRDSSHTDFPREWVRCERVPTAANAGAAAPAALQQPDAMHVAGEARPGVEAASRSTFAFAAAGDSSRAPAAASDERFPDRRVGKRAEFPRAVGQFRTMGTLGL